MTRLGDIKNTLIGQGHLIKRGLPALITREEWLEIYRANQEELDELEGVQGSKIQGLVAEFSAAKDQPTVSASERL